MPPQHYFTKENTKVLKGIAILMMLLHHFYNGSLSAPIHWADGNHPMQIAATVCKVCVSLFAFLSGYGLTEQYRKKSPDVSDRSFVLHHLKNLMRPYWLVFFIFVPLGFLLGENPVSVYQAEPKGIFYFILDALALSPLFQTPTMNFSWWYMEAALIFYLGYPFFYRGVKRIPFLVLPVSFALFAGFGTDHCREIFWMFPFFMGIFYSEQNLLNRYLTKLNQAIECKSSNRDPFLFYQITSVVSLLLWLYLRTLAGLWVDVFLAISITKCSVCWINPQNTLGKALSFFGKNAAFLYFTHSFFYYYYEVCITLLQKIPFRTLQFFCMLAVSLLASMLLGAINKSRICHHLK